MTKPELLIEVYTDVMCPWCWCGEEQLQKTLRSEEFQREIAPYMRPKVQLRPFLLDNRLPATSFEPPTDHYVPIESTDYQKGKPPTKKEYYSKKFTSFDAFDTKISKRAQELGLPKFDWLNEGKVGATWLAHKLLWAALSKENQDEQNDGKDGMYAPQLQERLMERLYRAFHHENKDMSDVDVLASLACEMEMFEGQKESAKRWLLSEDGDYELGHALEMGERNGIQSIPFTIIQDGADHSSQMLSHDDLMRMFKIQVDFSQMNAK